MQSAIILQNLQRFIMIVLCKNSLPNFCEIFFALRISPLVEFELAKLNLRIENELVKSLNLIFGKYILL